PVIDLRAAPAEERQSEACRVASNEAQRPFDLARGPLLRATLLRLAERSHWLLLTIHHIVADGWSLAIVVRELTSLYSQFARRAEAQLPEPPLQYGDFAFWQRRQLQADVLSPQLAYWRRK